MGIGPFYPGSDRSSVIIRGMDHLQRAFIIVLDGVGIGEAPDAAQFGDEGRHTLGHTAEAVGGLSVPNLERLGLGNIAPLRGVQPAARPLAAWGKMAERSPGKDTTTGHWEMMGLVLDHDFPTFPQGFPPEIIRAFERATGREVLCNAPASGTEVIARYGAEQARTGKWIVYTSADSVFQIAAHEDVIPLEELHAACHKARELLTGPFAVGRIIARPFTGLPGAYERDQRNRHDYSLLPEGPTLLDHLVREGRQVIGVGKIHDIFAGQGVSASHGTGNDQEGMEITLRLAAEAPEGALVFTNLVDFDSRYGHREDPRGMAEALARFDAQLGELLPRLRPGDLLLITADHGNDPTDGSTDHTRECVPLLAHRPGVPGTSLGTRESFADLGATLAEAWHLGTPMAGRSFWRELDGALVAR